MNKQRKSTIVIGVMLVSALVIVYFKAREINAVTAASVLCYGSMGIVLSALLAMHEVKNKLLALRVFYLISVVLMLLLKSPLGVYTNGVTRWLGINGICLIRPANVLLVATILMIAMESLKWKKKLEWKEILLRNIPYAAALYLFLTLDTYWDIVFYVMVIAVFFAVRSGNKRQILTSLLITLAGIVAIGDKHRWYRGQFEREMLLSAIKTGGLFGSDSEQFLYHKPDDAIILLTQKWGVCMLLFILVFFVVFSIYIFKTKKIATENKDKFGKVLVMAIGLHFLVATLTAAFAGILFSGIAGIPFLDVYGMELLLFCAEVGIVQSVCVKKEVHKEKVWFT